MATKVKGILKGLRYISQIFDDQKEPEMQIGYPTDVKHVAHIGWEGPSANNTPTWMRGFNSTTPEVSSGQFDSLGEDNKLSSEDIKRNGGGIKETLLQHIKSAGSGSSPTNSPRRSSDAPKHSRRYRSTDASTDSPSRDSPGSTRHSRRYRNSINGKDLPSQDLPAVPKHSRRRKSKGSSGGGSIKALRSKDQNSLPDIHFTDMESGSGSGHGHGLIKSNENQLNSVLEKEGDGI